MSQAWCSLAALLIGGCVGDHHQSSAGTFVTDLRVSNGQLAVGLCDLDADSYSAYTPSLDLNLVDRTDHFDIATSNCATSMVPLPVADPPEEGPTLPPGCSASIGRWRDAETRSRHATRREACIKQRIEQSRAAMRMSPSDERTNRLVNLPRCDDRAETAAPTPAEVEAAWTDVAPECRPYAEGQR